MSACENLGPLKSLVPIPWCSFFSPWLARMDTTSKGSLEFTRGRYKGLWKFGSLNGREKIDGHSGHMCIHTILLHDKEIHFLWDCYYIFWDYLLQLLAPLPFVNTCSEYKFGSLLWNCWLCLHFSVLTEWTFFFFNFMGSFRLYKLFFCLLSVIYWSTVFFTHIS